MISFSQLQRSEKAFLENKHSIEIAKTQAVEWLPKILGKNSVQQKASRKSCILNDTHRPKRVN